MSVKSLGLRNSKYEQYYNKCVVVTWIMSL